MIISLSANPKKEVVLQSPRESENNLISNYCIK